MIYAKTMENKKKPIIIGFGELLWDVLPSGKKAGGAPVNFAYHAARSGAESYAISAIGNDDAGDELLGELRKHRIGHCIEQSDYPTGTVLVELTNGIPEYTICENVAWDHIPLTKEMIELARNCQAICYGTLGQRDENSRSTLRDLIAQTSQDAYKIFDINIRQHYYSRQVIEETLLVSNVLKINDEELRLLRPMLSLSENESTAVNQIMKRYQIDLIIITAGAEYSAIYSKEAVSILPTPTTEVVDTVGAGDSFTGSFMSSLLLGKSLSEAHQIAVRTAAFVCTQNGAWPTYS